MANVWVGVARVNLRSGPAFWNWLGIEPTRASAVMRLWSRIGFSLATAAIGGLVLVSVLATLSGVIVDPGLPGGWNWSSLILAIALARSFVIAEWWRSDRVEAVMALATLSVLAVWWLAAMGSPLVTRFGVNPRIFLPEATAIFAVGSVWAGMTLVKWSTADAALSARLDAFAIPRGLGDPFICLARGDWPAGAGVSLARAGGIRARRR